MAKVTLDDIAEIAGQTYAMEQLADLAQAIGTQDQPGRVVLQGGLEVASIRGLTCHPQGATRCCVAGLALAGSDVGRQCFDELPWCRLGVEQRCVVLTTEAELVGHEPRVRLFLRRERLEKILR